MAEKNRDGQVRLQFFVTEQAHKEVQLRIVQGGFQSLAHYLRHLIAVDCGDERLLTIKNKAL
jgi:hypothetical protein